MSPKTTPDQPDGYSQLEIANSAAAQSALNVMKQSHPPVDDFDYRLDDIDVIHDELEARFHADLARVSENHDDDDEQPPSAFIDSYSRFEETNSASAITALGAMHLLHPTRDDDLLTFINDDLGALADDGTSLESDSFGFNTYHDGHLSKRLPHQGAAAELVEKQDLSFYNPFRLPEADRHFYNEEEKIQSIVAKVKPLTEPVKVVALDSSHISISIGDSTTVRKREGYGSGQVLSVNIKELREFTMVKISGSLIGGRTVDFGSTNADQSVLCFESKDLAKQFKRDLLCVYAGVVSKPSEDAELDQLLSLDDDSYVVEMKAQASSASATSNRMSLRDKLTVAVLVPVGLFVASFAVISGFSLAKSLF